MSIQNTLSTWDELLETARKNTSARRVRRPGQSPSTAPIPSSLHSNNYRVRNARKALTPFKL